MRGKGKGERGSSIYQRLPSHQCNKSKLKLHEREGEGVVSFPGRFVGGGKTVSFPGRFVGGGKTFFPLPQIGLGTRLGKGERGSSKYH